MLTYIIRRLSMIVPVLLGVSLLVFAIAKVTPGDPARLILGQFATPERIAKLHRQLHLDDPVWMQYGHYLWNALHGDFGVSYRGQKPVLRSILTRFPDTLELTVAGLMLAVLSGIPAGMLAARFQGTRLDRSIMIISVSLLSIPVFWLAILLLYLFGVYLNWFNVTGNQGIKDLILPSLCLAIAPAAVLTRLTHASILETLREDYVRTAHSKGLSDRLVMTRHVLRNAFIPIATYLGLMFAGLLGGAVFIESVFARSGLGRFIINAIAARDFPEIQGAVLFTATVYVVLNLVVDLLYAYVDPRIQYT